MARPQVPGKVIRPGKDCTNPFVDAMDHGLIFTFQNGGARAFFQGEYLEISGDQGRYRIKTDTFEAGIAFGADYGTKVYAYLREK